MSSKTQTMATKEEAKPALVPKLRFPEFRKAEGWKVAPLGELGAILTGKTPSTKEDDLWGGEILFITPTDITEDEKYQRTTQRTVVETTGTKVLPAGTVVYTCIASIGKMAITVFPSISNQQINAVVPNAKTAREFIYYSLANLTPWIKSIPATSTLPIINKTQFSGFIIPHPEDKAEQQKIAECLSSVDELMAAQARKVAALKTHKKGLMQQLFPREGETQPRFRFPEFQNAGEWVVGLIGKLATTVMGNAFRSTDFVESGTQVVRIGNLYQGELQLDRAPVFLSDSQADENIKFQIKPFDLLMSMTGTVGKRDYGFVIQTPADCKPLLLNQRVMKLAPTVKCNPGFLLQLLKSDRLLDAIYSVPGGTKQANLSAQHIKDIEVSYPPKSEQQRIADCLTSLDDLIAAQTQKHEALKTHKKGLMQQLFPAPEEVEA